MARQDIDMNPVYGELNLTDNLTSKVMYDFTLIGDVAGRDNDRYVYGEIVLPGDFEKKVNRKREIRFRMPYTPLYRELMVRFRLDVLNGRPEYLLNAVDGQPWFRVCVERDGLISAVRVCEFFGVNERGVYNLIFGDGYLLLFSGEDTDLVIRASKYQNEVFLLKAFAGNLYQHPTTGVGLIDFLHGNYENADLAAKLQQEFTGDKMTIVSASMNSYTGELYLEVRE